MRLKRRITIQKPNASQDALGQPVPSWTDVRSMYATIREGAGRGQKPGRENLRDEQVEHRGGMEVEIYHPRGGTFPSVQHRIQWTEWDTGTVRTANIDHVGRVMENRKRLILYCTEVQS